MSRIIYMNKMLKLGFAVLSLIVLMKITLASADDFTLSNQILQELESGNLEKAETMINDFSDSSLKELWIYNVVLAYFEGGNLDKTLSLTCHINIPSMAL